MAKQLLGALIALGAILLLVLAVFLRRAPTSIPAGPAPTGLPAPPVVDAARPTPPPPPEARDRTALAKLLETIGRATVLRDRRALAALRIPELDAEDRAWIVAQLRGPTFTAAGACVVVSVLRMHEAVAALDEVLKSTANLVVKDAAIDALARLPGDASLAILLGVLKGPYDDSLRARAAAALAPLDYPEVYRALADAFQNDSKSIVRGAAADALRGKGREAVLLFLKAIRRERDAHLLTQIVVLAWEVGGKESLDDLRDAILSNYAAREALEEAIKRDGAARYQKAYAAAFFDAGGVVVPFAPAKHTRIGVTVDLGAGLRLADISAMLFRIAPFDRYREFFYFRIGTEFADDIANGSPSPRAYDWNGVGFAQGLPRNERDGTVFLAFKDPATFAPGILGLTEGSKAQVTVVSLLHEFGHAFAQLADEYDADIASPGPAENLAPRQPAEEYAWKPLVQKGLLPEPRNRVELKDGVDIGQWRVPSNECHMNNHPTDERFCPVCQLAIIARIAELSGVAVPW